MILDFTPFEEEKFRYLAEESVNRKNTDELLRYDDFVVKDELFGINLSFTETSDFFSFLNKTLKVIPKGSTFIFRGVGEASYRLFNKAQRNFRLKQSGNVKSEATYHSSILAMLEKAKTLEQNILVEYFNSFGVKENDIAILSFLQHYGAPTPLLDWTYDVNVAIFFALHDLIKDEYKPSYNESENKIDNFFSIYFMREDMPKYMINDYKQLSIHTKGGATYQTFKKRQVAHISEIYKHKKPKFFIQNNFRILKQRGLFIYNNSPYLPLEEVFYKRSLMYYLLRSPKDNTVPRSPIFCMNIHKSIAQAIKIEIAKKGYTKSSMFLDAKRLARNAVPKSLS